MLFLLYTYIYIVYASVHILHNTFHRKRVLIKYSQPVSQTSRSTSNLEPNPETAKMRANKKSNGEIVAAPSLAAANG